MIARSEDSKMRGLPDMSQDGFLGLLEPDLHRGDCLDVMQGIPDGSVDMVMTDPPFGTTACKWDSVIPFEPMWVQLKRIVKPSGAIVLMASQPFTSALVMSNVKMFKYCWVWEKTRTSGFWDCAFRPLKGHEDIVVFSAGGAANGSKIVMVYNPQGILPAAAQKWTSKPLGANSRTPSAKEGVRKASNYPRSVQRFDSEGKTVHPTQKPVALMEYLIRTYTNAGETVLDFTMGSGTTGVAAANTDRNFIGIERDPEYFDIAVGRIQQARQQFDWCQTLAPDDRPQPGQYTFAFDD